MVITGGLRGLGGCIVEIFTLKGVTVCVLDIGVSKLESGKEEDGVHYYHCDIAQVSEIEETWKRIKKEVGTPTVLINNAGINTTAPLTGFTSDQIDKIFRVNTLSHFCANNLFLRDISSRRNGGTIVTVASILGHVAAAGVGPYSASKAALSAYHTALSAELSALAPQVKTILVAPGQLDTQLFATMELKGRFNKFVGPIVPVSELAVQIVQMIAAGEAGVIREPFYARILTIMPLLPMSLQKFLRWYGEVDVAPSRGLPSSEKKDEKGKSLPFDESDRSEDNSGEDTND